MALFPDMRVRRTEPELMDLPDIDLEKLHRTLKQFESINRMLSASRRLLRKFLFPIIDAQPDNFSILDVGAGACDIPKWIARIARKRDWNVRITALDADARIVKWAKDSAIGYPEIDVVEGSALELDRVGEYNFIIANHFLHHMTNENLPIVMAKINDQAKNGFLVNDLRRRAWAYAGFSLYATIFARNSLSRVDGMFSIRKGFLPEDLNRILDSGLSDHGVEIFTTFPARIGFIRKTHA